MESRTYASFLMIEAASSFLNLLSCYTLPLNHRGFLQCISPVVSFASPWASLGWALTKWVSDPRLRVVPEKDAEHPVDFGLGGSRYWCLLALPPSVSSMFQSPLPCLPPFVSFVPWQWSNFKTNEGGASRVACWAGSFSEWGVWNILKWCFVFSDRLHVGISTKNDKLLNLSVLTWNFPAKLRKLLLQPTWACLTHGEKSYDQIKSSV